jgi:DNA-binding response OmpR family regulator
VLLVTDQPVLAAVIRLTMDHSRFGVRWMAATAATTAVLARELPHLVLLDMDVEDLGGARVMERIGCERLPVARLPVIALTRRGDLKAKLAAFDLGVDDVLTVPCSPEELLARCLALMRRTYGAAVAFAPAVQVGELEIDVANRRVQVGTAALHLSPLELRLLYLLVANSGSLLTRDEILDSMWGTDYIAESNVVDRHIRNLRTKLQDDWRRPRYIATVPGRGYRFLPAPPASPRSTC